jgi:hypothetical protein
MRKNTARKGLAAPISLLILISSFTILSTATYYVAMSSINAKAGNLNYSAAKQEMLVLDGFILTLARSPGSAMVLTFQGYAGIFRVRPELRYMAISISLGSVKDIIFSSNIGLVEYELPSTDVTEAGLYLAGDAGLIVNRSSTTMSQLCIVRGANGQDSHLGYRPLVSYYTETLDNEAANTLRIYLINLNSSRNSVLQGNFKIRVSGVNVTCQTRDYRIPSQVTAVTVTASVDGRQDAVIVRIPESVTTIVRTELIVFNVRLEEVKE